MSAQDMQATGNGGRTGNALLDALDTSVRASTLAHADRVTMRAGEVIFEAGRPIRRVHFPVSAVLSLVTASRDGAVVEVATVGKEGMMGLPVFFGTQAWGNMRGIVQVPGETIAVDADEFERQATDGQMRDVMHSYAHALIAQAGQEVACNRLHAVLQRTGRWLLMTHDRVGSDRFRLTQEFLATMLGVRRASVTEAAGALQRAGAIRYRRGDMTITDRRALESMSCECYTVVRAEFERVMPNGKA